MSGNTPAAGNVVSGKALAAGIVVSGNTPAAGIVLSGKALAAGIILNGKAPAIGFARWKPQFPLPVASAIPLSLCAIGIPLPAAKQRNEGVLKMVIAD